MPEGREKTVTVEHPTGGMDILLAVETEAPGGIGECSFLRTARKLFDGTVFA
ncbi:hypothetical protein D3C73_1626390 [compost metagenome]